MNEHIHTTHNTTQKQERSVRGLQAKLYPNGECVVYKPKLFKPEPLRPHQEREEDLETMRLLRMMCLNPDLRDWAPLLLGLSPHTNFDSLIKNSEVHVTGPVCPIKRYGTNGITSFGARRVRNAAYLIEKGVPIGCAVFSTCTVPSLPIEDMRSIHERWHKVVEVFRRKLTRALRKKGLSGESVTVSEIQGKRYERTGIPVLHIHTVFHGRTRTGKPAISTKEHDDMWRDALMVGVIGPMTKLGSACNLQWVKKSAQGYLGKYMSKGTKVVRRLCKTGFTGWLPKQWWSVSRSLGARVDEETRQIDEFADTLNDWAEMEGTDIWIWHKDVTIELGDGTPIRMARYGKLSNRQTAQIQEYYDSVKPRNMTCCPYPAWRSVIG